MLRFLDIYFAVEAGVVDGQQNNEPIRNTVQVPNNHAVKTRLNGMLFLPSAAISIVLMLLKPMTRTNYLDTLSRHNLPTDMPKPPQPPPPPPPRRRPPLPPPPPPQGPPPPAQDKDRILAQDVLSVINENDILKSKCQCGRLELSVPIHAVLPLEFGDKYKAAVDCHCPSCRKYHVSAFPTYLLARHENVEITGTSLKAVRDSCSQLGPVVRMQCGVCHSKLATRPLRVEERHGHQMLLNMGAIDDSCIPPPMAKFFAQNRMTWQWDRRAVWATAQATANQLDNEALIDQNLYPRESKRIPEFVTGSCTCGQSKYRIQFESPMEQQHCYCRLCRRLSGSPFMTWVPFWAKDFEWVSDNTETALQSHEVPQQHSTFSPSTQQYVPHGRRHVCSNCGGVLTIVYRGQEDMIWPAAGSLDDDSLPGASSVQEFGDHLHNVMHISCRYKQPWYDLPEDGNERIPEAG